MLTAVFITQLVIGLIIYGRGWWHAAFAAEVDGVANPKQLYITLRGYTINLSAVANGALGLAMIVCAIIGLVAVHG